MIVPEDILKAVPAEVCSAYLRWAQYMYDNVSFSRPESKLHAMEHCERVLLFALLIGRDLFPDDEDALRHWRKHLYSMIRVDWMTISIAVMVRVLQFIFGNIVRSIRKCRGSARLSI